MSKDLGFFRKDEISTAQVGDKVTYIGYKWKVIEVMPHGSRVLYRPWWKIRKTGVVLV